MALPQGLNFRQTSGFVTDVSPATFEIFDPGGSGTPQYPRTTAQGNTVGYETGLINSNARNRNAGNDARIAGSHEIASSVQRYRIDLPSSGTYNIRSASGDGSYSKNAYLEVLDTTSSLGVLVNNASTGVANSFYDASGTLRTALLWPTLNTSVSKTFTTTICRFKFSTGSASSIAHLYIESAGGATDTPVNPGVGALVFSGFAPAITQPQSAAPLNAGLVLTGFSPSILQPQSASPLVSGMALTGFAPTITQAANQNVTPGLGSIVITGFAPTVTRTTNTFLTIGIGNVVFTGLAPTVVRVGSYAATILDGGVPNKAKSAQIGVGLKPIVYTSGRFRQRQASEGAPLIWDPVTNRWRLLRSGEILDI